MHSNFAHFHAQTCFNGGDDNFHASRIVPIKETQYFLVKAIDRDNRLNGPQIATRGKMIEHLVKICLKLWMMESIEMTVLFRCLMQNF